jgi:molecular chaperone GrpE
VSENEETEPEEMIEEMNDHVEQGGRDDDGLDSIETSDELAAALREAEQAVDQREAEEAGAPGDVSGHSADKMTIEILSQELQSLKAEHEEALASNTETEDKLLRLTAEFDNFRRRTLKEKQDTFKYGHQNLVKDLLGAVDNLERAVAHGGENQDGDYQILLQGVELVQRELMGALGKHGVQSIDAAGKIFDPAFHEAMAQVPNPDLPANTVIDVLQTGYVLSDRMLRPARVVVSKEVEGTGIADDAPPAREEQ